VFVEAASQQLCRNTSTGNVGSCSSSLRYKTKVEPFRDGLEIVNRLHPIAFTWKQGGMSDIGLAAEDVEKVESRLTFRNDKGEIEGVNYNQMNAVLINAIQQQQQQVEALRAELETIRKTNHALNARLEAVEKLKATTTCPEPHD
jgi:hypothetical protein